ncbi:MAG: O-antigen ligase family protein [Gammaproteobacteria bacterium]
MISATGTSRRNVEARVHPWVLALVMIAPLPLGGARPLPEALFATLTAILLAAWALGHLRSEHPSPVAMSRLAWVLAPATTVILWLALREHLVDGPPFDYRAGDAIMHLATLLGVYLLCVQCGRSSRLALRAFHLLVLAGALYAAYGLTMHLGGFDTVLIWDRWAYRDSVTSTFVNRNHYATYAGMSVILTLAVLLNPTPSRSRHPAAQRMTLYLERQWPLLGALLLTLMALLLTESRAGLLSTGVGMAVFLLLLARTRIPRISRHQLIAVGMVAGLLLALFGSGTAQRFAVLKISEIDRLVAAEITAGAITDAPVVGHGAGRFAEVFARLRDARLPGRESWLHAHNDYLELALEWGIPATLLVIIIILTPAVASARGALKRRHDAALAAAGPACVALCATHAIVDFSAQTLGVGMTLAAVLGISYAQSWSKSPATPER